ncbi:hypothetical protein [Xanthomonas phage RTH11]|nr:hypothetical protein [Xanthomonas phage RTH11]
MKTMFFTAVCGYAGLEKFSFFSVDFSVEQWSDLEKVGQAMVEEEWAKISPHPAPTILQYVPGGIVQLSDEEYKSVRDDLLARAKEVLAKV